MLKVAQSANVAVRQMRTDNFDQGGGYAYLQATCADVLAGLVPSAGSSSIVAPPSDRMTCPHDDARASSSPTTSTTFATNLGSVGQLDPVGEADQTPIARARDGR
jgi:hypothetical protein